jgi:hypothetical protein
MPLPRAGQPRARAARTGSAQPQCSATARRHRRTGRAPPSARYPTGRGQSDRRPPPARSPRPSRTTRSSSTRTPARRAILAELRRPLSQPLCLGQISPPELRCRAVGTGEPPQGRLPQLLGEPLLAPKGIGGAVKLAALLAGHPLLISGPKLQGWVLRVIGDATELVGHVRAQLHRVVCRSQCQRRSEC